MKKLQLIRPWKLSAVRQHLSCDEVVPGNMDNLFFTPCRGPVAEVEEAAASYFDGDNARTARAYMHVACSNGAPAATVSFISTNNTIIR